MASIRSRKLTAAGALCAALPVLAAANGKTGSTAAPPPERGGAVLWQVDTGG